MVDVRFERVIALPAVPMPNTLYFVKPAGSQVVFLYTTDINGRALPVETGQALALSAVTFRLLDLDEKLNLIFERLGLAVPDLANTPIDSTLLVASVNGAPEAFDALQSTADEQDARLDQLEAA